MKVFNSKRRRMRIIGKRNCRMRARGFLKCYEVEWREPSDMMLSTFSSGSRVSERRERSVLTWFLAPGLNVVIMKQLSSKQVLSLLQLRSDEEWKQRSVDDIVLYQGDKDGSISHEYVAIDISTVILIKYCGYRFRREATLIFSYHQFSCHLICL